MTISRFDAVQSAPVEVTAFGFRKDQKQGRLESFPKRMVYDGREYTFLESGMHYLIQKGQDLIRLFDVSDGTSNFRLRDADGKWTIVQMHNI